MGLAAEKLGSVTMGRDGYSPEGMQATVADICKATGGRLVRGDPGLVIDSVGTDSRKVAAGQLFVGLRGERFDGADFAAQAVEKGAAAVMIERARVEPALLASLGHAAVIEVPDTLRALGDLAAWHRRRFDIEVVGITGSNGKTTTKQMCAAVAGGEPSVLSNPGNLNNLVGLPLTLLGLRQRHRRAVLEMGMNRPGEIARLAEIAAPSVGVVTNVHPVHLEGLGSLEAIAEAKAELIDGLAEGSIAVLNIDDPLVVRMKERVRGRCLAFGKGPGADVTVANASQGASGLNVELVFQGRKYGIGLERPGVHNAMNAAAAFCVGLALGVEPEEIARRLESVSWPDMRMERVPAGRGWILVDCYNANPRSTMAAVETLVALAEGKKACALLGDMLELGESGPLLHRQLGQELARQSIDALCAFGPLMAECAGAAREAGIEDVEECQDIECAAAWLAERLKQGCAVLVKGSRGMALERAVEAACRTLGCNWRAGGK